MKQPTDFWTRFDDGSIEHLPYSPKPIRWFLVLTLCGFTGGMMGGLALFLILNWS